ncbi:FdhF/YdeP family oxidoreductase [Acidobacteria bacterium AH-259-D05]|nr:FdhF/YdeP family oxidoreductase [Acidobacteria bacterium AH-259-D05]
MKNRLIRQIGPYKEILQTLWRNRDQPGYAWRILRDGVCDGCALGTNGLRDWTMSDIHLCWIRLNLLRLNTVSAFDTSLMSEVTSLEDRPERELRELGRMPEPMIRRRGDKGFQPIDWETALDLVADRLRSIDPKRLAFYLVSRGTVNETYYVAQKVARLLGTNHIDNSARVCHAPSTVALKQSIGYAATTCSYRDVIGSDLVVFIGSDVANNQPVMMKYIHLAKKQGTKVAVINPFREPGLEQYFVPSNVESALFGTQVCNAFFSIKVGGDIAFINGVIKYLIAHDWIDRDFIAQRTVGWEALVCALEEQSFEELEQHSGAERETMLEFARLYSTSRTAVFVWSMGVTMHRHGVANVKAVSNLALARGNVGKPKTGLMAIRGHSGVQGGAEMGCVPNQYPGGSPVGQEEALHLEKLWGFQVPAWKGYFVAEMVDAAFRGEIDALLCVGSNLLNVLPDSRYVREALARIPLRIHHDIVLNPQMLVAPAEVVLILPATTRYEMEGGGTETSTERRVIFNPEIPGPRIDGARDEWRFLMELAQRVRPHLAEKIHFESTAAIRQEIARVIPLYDGIQALHKKGDQFQWGGPLLASSRFGFPDGRARFNLVVPPQREVPPGYFHFTTRRGKQFNSMVFGEMDMLVGTKRNEVVLSVKDMDSLKLKEGDSILVRSETGEFRGRVRKGPVQPGTIIMYWPEANILIPRGVSDPECGIPAYRDAVVEVITT